ncbi:MAG: transcription elongation factor GreA [Phycisphaeraceae bacterium]|nr:transcription elongation factor GreA [Phycisphaeraceae bacterium]MCW5768828.1 transcription elongation factor GreA [Phycisphaeraceae bacterium]
MDIMTPEERVQLEVRLNTLLANRSAISERIAEARALGDLKENAEYHAAREQQGLEEAEIRRLEERLAKAHVISTDLGKTTGQVFLGSTVKLREVDSGEEELYKLVGDAQAGLDSEIIEVTVTSPMGEALFKANVGETIRVRTRRGLKAFVVVELV